MLHIMSAAGALLLAACTTIRPAPTSFDQTSVPREQVVVNEVENITNPCSNIGVGPFAAACTCYRENRTSLALDTTGSCTVPKGKLCIIWVTDRDDKRTMEHELAHCALGQWHPTEKLEPKGR